MKQIYNTIKVSALAVTCLAIPLLYIYHTMNVVNPFHLTGKQFLHFFIVLSFTSLTVAVAYLMVLKRKASVITDATHKENRLQPAHCIVLVLMIGAIRLVQGIINAKPVGFLVILLFANLVMLLIIRSLNKEK